jgi:hypothetical protein
LKIGSILAIAAAAAVLTEKFIIQTFTQNWLVFASATAGGGIVYFLIVWVLGFASADEKLLFKRLISR